MTNVIALNNHSTGQEDFQETALTELVETPPVFDYSQVNENMIMYLKRQEGALKKIIDESVTEIGKILYETQQKLASHDKNKGIFESWYLSLGFSKMSVYRLINRYNYVVTNWDNMKGQLVENLPLSLSYEVTKPNAPKELVERVFDGDIRTHAEYKRLQRELEKKSKEISEIQEKLTEKDEQLASKQQLIGNLLNKQEQIQAAEPKVVEKIVEVNNPELEEALNLKASQVLELNRQILAMKEELEELKELKDKEDVINDTYLKVEDMKMKHGKLLKEYDDIKKISNYLSKAKEVLTKDLMIIPLVTIGKEAKETLKEDITQIINVAENWIMAMKEKFNI